MPGSTHAARNEAPTRPIANRSDEYCPASGTSAFAASAAVLILIPAGNRTVPVVRMMNHVTISAAIAPDMLSTRWPGMSLASRFFSTTLLETMKIMYGEIVVPMFATRSDT